ncbi:MAG: hypothetical protein IJQ56_08230 [Synergistaceae bacterium]|nr:hypothetical protein [Synergistaceae bacterium]MBR0204336.1 hypothetical protein [Synergistaceae bacterium]
MCLRVFHAIIFMIKEGRLDRINMYLNFIAAGLALAGIIMNLFQGFIEIPFIGKAGLCNILIFAFDNNNLFTDLFKSSERVKIIAGLIFLAGIPVIAMTGGVRAALKKGGQRLLFISAVMCVVFAVFLRLIITKTGDSLGENASLLANLVVNYSVPVIWAVIYAAAAFIASGKKISIKLPSRKLKTRDINSHSQVKPESTPQINISLDKYKSPCGKDYEAMTLRALIKEGLSCLSQAKFDDADKYFEHALIRNPESSNAYMGRLMVKYQAKNANDLVTAPVLLETEEFFQKALMFSSPRMRELLDKYRRVNRQRRGS